ncbi:hypothetical protein ACFQMA_12980 [Halosimplex aquaticum]|uniref:DUF456 domain-containing protein n=1 Tax=Halosimplex aquaticum TaxID=3026162 RepID=A0ABD5Y024_9EURY|nr:hypothetical protein [Halosimplex aquaticum]
MSERTDERTSGDDVDDLLDDEFAGDIDASGGDDVGLGDDELGVDVDALTTDVGASGGSNADAADPSATESDSASGPGLLSRLTPSLSRPSLSLPSLAPDVPSARSFLLALVVVIGGMLAGSAVPLVGTLAGVAGIFLGAFVLGLASGQRRYLPVAVAGAAAAVVSITSGAFVRFALLSDLGLTQFAAVGATTGILVAVLGHYFGRDLRDGLTRDV